MFKSVWQIMFISLLFLGGDFFTPAYAQDKLAALSKELIEFDLLPEQEFEAQTDLYEETPFDDETMAFSLRLPKGWSRERGVTSVDDFAMAQNVFLNIQSYFSPPTHDLRSRFVVLGQKLQYDLSIRTWFLQYVLSNGFVLEGINVIDDRRLEALFILVEGDVSYAVRVYAEKTADKIIMGQYFLPVAQWNEKRAFQSQVIKSFTITNPSDETVEEIGEHFFLDIATVFYPKSWEMRPRIIRSVDRMKTILINKSESGDLNGRIEVTLVADFGTRKISEEITEFKEKIEAQNLMLTEAKIVEPEYKIHSVFDFLLTEIYIMKSIDQNSKEYEVWISAGKAGDYFYYITMTTPARDNNFFIWSRNMETYKYVIETLEPSKRKIID